MNGSSRPVHVCNVGGPSAGTRFHSGNELHVFEPKEYKAAARPLAPPSSAARERWCLVGHANMSVTARGSALTPYGRP
jgi:hypothetical protein